MFRRPSPEGLAGRSLPVDDRSTVALTPGRLRSLRLVGFKSFAEKTVVEFGGGISAVVGPNGSGKSNLADALRWVLGEQGRTLRTRRAEDLIYAGSSTRRAQGMSDVTLVLDNADRLLPVDFAEVELGRRLFRSGENEFLLNRQKLRLRDLVDLLDEANLADNAFLFIGQGMVDQALALRPEERRPLFEEAAGIRKHERRRRAAEAELVQAEANLERVRDLVDELRPQARRLGAQAEQQRERRSAGAELSAALVAAARDRLGDAEREVARQSETLARSRSEADVALSRLREAEEAVASAGQALAERQELEQATRDRLEAARAVVLEIRLEASRVASEAEALARDLARTVAEREMLQERIERARQEMAIEIPDLDHAAEEALREVVRRIDETERSIRELRDAGRADAERTSRAREARAAHEAELGRAQRRAIAAAEALAAQQVRAETARVAATAATAELSRLEATRRHLVDAEAAAELAAMAARDRLTDAEARAAEPLARMGLAHAQLAGARAHLDALERRLQTELDPALMEAIASAGGRRIDDGLEVEPHLRRAVAAALGDVLTAMAVSVGVIANLDRKPGTFVVDGAPAARGTRERETAAVVAAAVARDGGTLGGALRRDPTGHVSRLLERCVWVPDLDAALALRPSLAPGWRVVTVSGELVTDEGVVALDPGNDTLEVRARHEELRRSVTALEAAVIAAEADRAVAATDLDGARANAATSRAALEPARKALRVVEEQLRGVTRTADAALREQAWAESQVERLEREAAAAAADRASREAEAAPWHDVTPDAGGAEHSRAEIKALDARLVALRDEQERHAAAAAVARRRRDEADDLRRRAEVRVGIDVARMAELERETQRLVGVRSDQADGADQLRERSAVATAAQDQVASALRALEGSSVDERQRRRAAEDAGAVAREQLRVAETRTRAAEVAQLQVRLQLDAGREALLVELAGIGGDGLRALLADAGDHAGDDGQAGPSMVDTPEPTSEEIGELLETALDDAFGRWRAERASGASGSTVSASRLGGLRRRYHELGAGNPFAAQELEEVRARLDGLESQQQDLTDAIRDTRALIARLETLIADQFRHTFTALEGAFARRFQQLFGGGEAALSLTAPEDLGATGVEITARPPGKKRQPLAMLSGGERALTAVALLLAMLEVRPVPFCVLDEVDAALDEANVGRFAAALRSLAENIQFIVITHNRGTIEAADALYGVTAGDDAVSHVVSLRLADLPSADGDVPDPAFAGAIR